MINIIKDLFGTAKDATGILRDVKEEKRKARGMKNAILGEVSFNLELILEHYLKSGIDAGIVIKKLQAEQLSRALADGYDFSNIKKGTISRKLVADVGFLAGYAGNDCETLLRKIKHHIDQLKLLPDIYDIKTTQKINVKARLENLAKRYLLFTRFLISR